MTDKKVNPSNSPPPLHPQVDKLTDSDKIHPARRSACTELAEVAELADALGSGLSGHYAREGSSPSFGTQNAANFAADPRERGFSFLTGDERG